MARYVLVWLALLVGTALTVWSSKWEIGGWALLLALFIATVKGTLVALFFMHLWDQPKTYRVVLAVSLMFVVIMILFIGADVHTRFPLARPQAMSPTISPGAIHEQRPADVTQTHKSQSEK